MENQVYVDGKWYDKSQAKVSVFDHGLLYGDGVFEGIRAYDNRVFKLDEHLKRLWESAHTITLEIPITMAELKRAIVETLKKNKLADAYIRVVVTRGEGDLGLSPWLCPKATVIIIADKINLYPKELYQNGLSMITVPTVRNLVEAVNPAIKSLNYLNNIMAKIEAKNGGCMEALLLNPQGYVAECTGDNIFMIKKIGKKDTLKDYELLTPPTYLGVLRGITRQAMIELAKKIGLPFSERVLTRLDLYNADEAFLTGTAAEIIPVVEIDGRQIGKGVPGKITKTLLKEFHTLTKHDGEKYTL